MFRISAAEPAGGSGVTPWGCPLDGVDWMPNRAVKYLDKCRIKFRLCHTERLVVDRRNATRGALPESKQELADVVLSPLLFNEIEDGVPQGVDQPSIGNQSHAR